MPRRCPVHVSSCFVHFFIFHFSCVCFFMFFLFSFSCFPFFRCPCAFELQPWLRASSSQPPYQPSGWSHKKIKLHCSPRARGSSSAVRVQRNVLVESSAVVVLRRLQLRKSPRVVLPRLPIMLFSFLFSVGLLLTSLGRHDIVLVRSKACRDPITIMSTILTSSSSSSSLLSASQCSACLASTIQRPQSGP